MTTGKTIRYLVEAALMHACFFLFGLLPVVAASAVGGWLGRTIGPRLAASRKAYENLRLAMPDLDEAGRCRVVAGMWDNLGRVIAEYPHLKTIARERTDVQDMGLFHRLRDDGQPAIVISGHLANWEIAGPAAMAQRGFLLDLIYREPNNPWVARLLSRARLVDPGMLNMKKSQGGTRLIVQTLKEGRHIGVLIDQKYNEGVPAQFFGRPAMTSPIYIHLAKRFKCPLVIARLERLPQARFRVTAVEIPCFDADGEAIDDDTLIAVTHRQLEEWIRARPEQWLWLHRRWSGRAEQHIA